MYQPFIFKLPSVTLNNKTITSDKDNIEMSYIKPYPLFTLGFHYYLHRTRDGMNITKNLQTKTEFYYVVILIIISILDCQYLRSFQMIKM